MAVAEKNTRAEAMASMKMRIPEHKARFLGLFVFACLVVGFVAPSSFPLGIQEAHAAPVLESFSFAGATSGTSIVGNKPTGAR